jgi:hypothetical protein
MKIASLLGSHFCHPDLVLLAKDASFTEHRLPETAFTDTKNSIQIDGFGEIVLAFQKKGYNAF